LDVLHSERFVDKAPRTVYATLLDEGIFLCSVSTMYRILRANGEVLERRKQRNHRNYTKPELLATQPNQVWSWDITKLRGPAKWHFYYLYVIMDIFSRYVVGWLVAHRESGDLAKELIQATCDNQGIQEDQLIIHSDRGSPMKSKTVAELLSDLKVGKSFGRPSVSNDNPFSEAQFKTLKYHPTFPDRFGSIQDARLLCREFFSWYNNDHYHSSLGFLTPKSVHLSEYQEIISGRAHVLEKAYGQHPERFVKGISKPALPPQEVWINPPQILVPTK
jgi:putative transposase